MAQVTTISTTRPEQVVKRTKIIDSSTEEEPKKHLLKKKQFSDFIRLFGIF